MFEVQPALASGGKAVYKNSNGQYLYYWPEHTEWRIAAAYKKEYAEAMVSSNSNTDTTCPQDSSGWIEYVGGSWKASNITVVAGSSALSRCRIASACSLCHSCGGHNQNLSRIHYTET